MLEVDEDGCGFGYQGDSARAGGDVLEGPPSLGEQGERAFAECGQGSQERVAGADISSSRPAAGCLTGVRMSIPAPS